MNAIETLMNQYFIHTSAPPPPEHHLSAHLSRQAVSQNEFVQHRFNINIRTYVHDLQPVTWQLFIVYIRVISFQLRVPDAVSVLLDHRRYPFQYVFFIGQQQRFSASVLLHQFVQRQLRCVLFRHFRIAEFGRVVTVRIVAYLQTNKKQFCFLFGI